MAPPCICTQWSRSSWKHLIHKGGETELSVNYRPITSATSQPSNKNIPSYFGFQVTDGTTIHSSQNINGCLNNVHFDYNLTILKNTEHEETEKFLNVLYQNFILPMVNKPTRHDNHSATLIDHFLSNNAHESLLTGNYNTWYLRSPAQALCFRTMNSSITKKT